MQKLYLFEETPRTQRILNDCYDTILAALKHYKPKSESLLDDDDFSQLHDCLALIKLGQIKIEPFHNEKTHFISSKINES